MRLFLIFNGLLFAAVAGTYAGLGSYAYSGFASEAAKITVAVIVGVVTCVNLVIQALRDRF